MTAVYGSDFWKQDTLGIGVDSRVICMSIVLFGSSIMVLENCLYVARAIRAKRGGRKQAIEAMLCPAPFLLMALTGLAWAVLSPSDILARRPVLFMGTLGTFFSKTVTQLMLSHVSKTNYNPWGKTMCAAVVFMLGMVAYCVTTTASPEDMWAEDAGLVALTCLALVTYVHLVVQGVWEVKEALGIACFIITPPPKASRA
mmetsp:Transcript_31627/g.84587  ORF Transcript_31627/g.84587 Transcript_31627/m.84587 type:complete len:200 (+) Transcript_31627:109-708(+)